MPADDPLNTGAEPDDLAQARTALVEALAGAGPHHATIGGEAEVVRADGTGLSIELRFNGATIPLDGNDANVLSEDAFDDFIARQTRAVEAGELDDAISATLQGDGTGKATARVRGVGATGE